MIILEDGFTQVSDEAYEQILDDMIEEIILNYIGYGMEDFPDAINTAMESFNDKAQVHSIPLRQEDVSIAIERVRQAAYQFTNELAQAYGELSKKFVGTKAWETYRPTDPSKEK
jgi:hypothetical protein